MSSWFTYKALVVEVWPLLFMLSSLFISFVIFWSFSLREVESPSMSFVKLAIWSSKDVVLVVITNMVPKLKALHGDWHGEASMSESPKYSLRVMKKVLHTPLDCFSLSVLGLIPLFIEFCRGS